MSVQQAQERGRRWRLRRLASFNRMIDVAVHCGISVRRYSAMERGRDFPTDIEKKLIEEFLPQLPESITRGVTDQGTPKKVREDVDANKS